MTHTPIQPGWRLVPEEPDSRMHDAARDWSYKKYGKPIGTDASLGCWQAMYAAAPQPPAPAAAEGEDAWKPEALRRWADLVEQGLEVPAAGPVMRQSADIIERLAADKARIAKAEAERDEALKEAAEAVRRVSDWAGLHRDEKARAEKAEAERDEARKAHRLSNEALWRAEARTEKAEADLHKEFDRAQKAEAERDEARKAEWDQAIRYKAEVMAAEARIARLGAALRVARNHLPPVVPAEVLCTIDEALKEAG